MFGSFLNNLKNLDPSYKTDLDVWDCLGKVKTCTIAKFHRTDSVICSHSIHHLIAEYLWYFSSKTNPTTASEQELTYTLTIAILAY